MIVLDSYAWIEYFLGSEAGKVVRRYLGAEEAATPSIVLAEVARKYLRERMEEKDVLRRLIFISASSAVAEIDTNLSLAAAKAYLELLEKADREKLGRPSLADGIILATGRAMEARILTGDEHFKGLGEVIYIGEKGT